MGSCLSIETPEPPARQFQRREIQQQVVSYPPTGMNYPTVKPSAPPEPTAPPVQYMPAYTYAQMPQPRVGTQWTQVPYQYQVYPPQQRYYVQQPVIQQQQPSSGIGGFAAGMLTGAVINSMLDDDPY